MSKTRMRELRRSVRNVLGVSRDPAPELGQVLRSLVYVEEMLGYTSGRYRHVEMIDRRTSERISPKEALRRHVQEVEEYRRAEHDRRMRELHGGEA